MLSAQNWLKMSGATATIFALVLLTSPETYLLWVPTLNELDASAQVMLAVTLLGWAVGKFACALSGPAPTALFCRLNVAPMVGMVYLSAREAAWDLPVWGAFLVAYVYFGFVEDSTPKLGKHWSSKSID